MNKRVLILHGLNGSDFPHWQAQLASDLIKENYIVSFPAFPIRDNPKLDVWWHLASGRGLQDWSVFQACFGSPPLWA